MRLAGETLIGLAWLASPWVWVPAGAEETAASGQLPEVVVVTTTPLVGTGIDLNKLPLNIQSLSVQELSRGADPSLIAAIDSQLGSVNINDNLDDAFQPDILFRGFAASPVLGTPQGLAVYQNGVRINEAFGDTLNWDLIPDIAVDRIDVFGASPVYGLNALGGAVVVTMKDGFSYRGGSAELSGGSWARRQGAFELGTHDGSWGGYVAGRLLKEDGWREFSPDSLQQLYAVASYRGAGLHLDLSYSGAGNELSGESPAPVQELAVKRSLIFTSPQKNANRLNFVTLSGSYAAGDTLSLQGNAYYRNYRQEVVNGNTTNYTACTPPADAPYLCQGDGLTPLITPAGGLVADISQGGTRIIGENDFESIRTAADGGSLQLTTTAMVLRHGNQLSVGGSVDEDDTMFTTSAEVGTINSALQVAQTGLFVNTPEGTPWTATPVNLRANNRYYGLFATDTLDLTQAIALTVSGRYNIANVDLYDQLGTALSGKNRYAHFNPAVGVTDQMTAGLTAYAGYSQGNRVPTAGEIECSDPSAPCLLPSSLSSDPPNLRQPIAHTIEAGVRGHLDAPAGMGERVSWNAGIFRTDIHDDIYAVATSLSSGYFQNIGGTRRQGAELGLRFHGRRIQVFASYSYVAATFRSSFLLPSSLNSAADANGNIQIRSGDTLPGIPAHRLKAGFDAIAVKGWTLGADFASESSRYFRGDESNQMPVLAGFAVVNLHSIWQPCEHLELFARIINLFDRHYATFGVLGNATGVGAPGVPATPRTGELNVDHRFESPSPPLSVFFGVRILL
jgi:iron complex outermembrane receptor protein